ncbi:MAG TPA: hypothetical protein VGH93_06930 [Solirubrobacteraceae bacterium]
MRRLTLSVFLCLAACGGAVKPSGTGAVDPSPDLRAEYQRYLFTAEARAAIAEFAKVSSQDALDSCLAAWVDEVGGPSGLNDPIAKPDVKGLRSFLAQCLGISVPVEARAESQASMRTAGAGNNL